MPNAGIELGKAELQIVGVQSTLAELLLLLSAGIPQVDGYLICIAE